MDLLNQKIDLHKQTLQKEYDKYLLIILSMKSLLLLILVLAVYILKSKTSKYLFENLNKSYNDLKYLNEKLSIATQSAKIGIWKWNIKENIVEWDERMYQIYEQNPSKSKNTYELWKNSLYKSDKEIASRELLDTVEKNQLYFAVFRINTKSGIKYINATGKTVYDNNKNPLYVVGTNRDITKEKEQEILIKRQSDSISKHVIYSRTDINGIIYDVSEAFCKISGYSKEELIGNSHNMLRTPEMPDKLYKKLWENLKEEKNWQGEIKNRKKDGTFYWVYSDISPEYDNNENLIGYISIRSDITIIKELEEKQIQFLEQSKMASLGEMIGNIAHQWRQPLSVITTASTGIILQKENGILTDKLLYDELNEINETAQYLSETINTFRDFVKEKKVYKEVLLQDRVNQSLKLLNSTIKSNHITLINNIEKKEPVYISIVLGELSQVLINIINNSKDAIIENKIVEPFIKLDLELFNDKIILTIEDNAGGIPQEFISKIFEPYFTTKHKSQGTGLGLYMSHKIIHDSLKGKLYAKNTQYGIKFFIELPLKKIKK